MTAPAWNISVVPSIGQGPIVENFDFDWPGLGFRRPRTHQSSENVLSLPTGGAATVHRTLARLRKYRALSQGWDGGHAAAPLAQSFDNAERFLALISTWKVPMQLDAQIFSGGTAVVNVKARDVDGQFEFLPDGTIAALIDRNGQEWDADVPNFNGIQIPEPIARRLPTV